MSDRRIAFLFTNSREEIIRRVEAGAEADTALRGMNHIAGGEPIVAAPQSLSSLLLIPRLLNYDFVIAQDNLFLGYSVSLLATLFHRPTRWLYVAMNSSMLIRRHANHPMRRFLLKCFWGSYARIICISREQLEDFARLGITRDRLVFIPFGVDAAFFELNGARREEELVVSVGRDSGRDYATLLKAAEQVNKKIIIVAGKKNILVRPIPPNVSVLYNLSLAEIRDLYARAALVVVPSKNSQELGGSDCSGQTVVLDALSAGKAVIATDRAWIRDYFVPDKDLVVVAPHDVEGLARAINTHFAEPVRRQFASSGHDKVVKHYTTKAFADALMGIMDSFAALKP